MIDGYISRKAAILAIRSIPNAVVFCGECEQYAEKGGYSGGFCKRTSTGVGAFEFCSRGVRKDEGMSDNGHMKCPRCGRPWDGEPLELTEDIRACFVCGYPICPRAKNIDKIRKLDAEQLGSILAHAMIGLSFSRKTDNWFFKEFSQFYLELRKVQDTSELSVREAVIMWLKQEADECADP